MELIVKPAESFRGDFTTRNSDAAILRFPFPFAEDGYMYAVNIEPHVQSGPTAAYDAVFDLDEHYLGECEDRAMVLEEDPLRCQVLPHMIDAEWDTLELLMENLARDYPALFSLSKNGDAWRWVNRPLGLDQSFTFGKAETLPYPPLRVHHPPGAGRLHHPGPARRQSVHGRRHGDEPGRLVAEL